MKHSIIIILSFATSLLSGQISNTLQIDYSAQDASLKEIFEDLEAEYDIRFSYACSSWLSNRVDVDFANESVEEVLAYLLEGQGMEYKIVSNNILLRKVRNYSLPPGPDYQKSLHIQGKVIVNGQDGVQLPFALVSISNSSVGTYTDSTGVFDIEIPEKYYDSLLIFNFLGFEEASYKISEADDEYMLIALSEKTFTFDEITIVNSKKTIRLVNAGQAITLRGDFIDSQTSGVMGSDINRKIQLLPGITAHDDDSAEIKIRGSNSDETLIVLDGMPLYNVQHFDGIFSSINATYIDSINIYKNTYPLQYGGKTGGLLELFGNMQQPVRPTTEIKLDLLSASVKSDIPLSQKSSLHLAARSTLEDVSNRQFNSKKKKANVDPIVQSFKGLLSTSQSDPNFHFYDINANYTYRPTSREQLQFNFFRSADQVRNDYLVTLENDRNDEVGLMIEEKENWSTSSSSFLWSRPVSKKIHLKTRAYYSSHFSKEIDDISLAKNVNSQGGPITTPPDSTQLGASQDNKLDDMGIDGYLRFQSGNHSWIVGAAATRKTVSYAFAENNDEVFSGSEKLNSASTYASYDFSFASKFLLSTGVRSTYYDNLSQFFLSPRLALSYEVSEQLSLKGAYSIYQQVIRQFYYEYRSEPMELWVAAGQNDIPVLTARNAMLGATYKMGRFAVDIEAYQKNLSGTLEYAVLNPTNTENNPSQAQDYKLFAGEGIVRGIDVMASYSYKNYESYLSYTLSKSLERYPEIYRNRYFAAENDRRHQLKWVNNLRMGRWAVDFNAIYSSGRRYTDIINIDANGDIRNADPDRRLKRLPAYTRIDLGATYELKVGKHQTAAFSASIFNLLNSQNVRYIQSVATQITENQVPVNAVIGNESALLNRTVNLGIEFSF